MAIITISRGTFGGGKELAESIAGRLGYRCISREELLTNTASQYVVPEGGLRAALDTKPGLLEQVKSTVTAMELPVEYAEIEMIPKTSIVIDNPETKAKLEKLFEVLDDHEEVEYIYSNSIL